MDNIMFIDWQEFLNNHDYEIATLLRTSHDISVEYDSAHKNVSQIGFNIFKIASDIYYRENFHSDIIKSLLDPDEKHLESYKYLHLFIDLLNKSGNDDIIDKSFYLNSKVIRESENIDILIVDEKSKRAILIENKINNAADMPRQIPRYYNLIKGNYIIDSIVYLTINRSKRPDMVDWTTDEIIEIKKLLKIIPAFDRSNSSNLYEDWLIKCIAASENIDNRVIIKQYANLIKYLSTNYMDTISLEKFYNTIKENENLKTSISIRNMLNDLPAYLAIRIEDRYKNNCYPFQKIWRYKERDTVFEAFNKGDIYLKMDVWCNENGYNVHIWNPQNENYNIQNELKHWDMINKFNSHKGQVNNVIINFTFHEEDNLFQMIDSLIVFLKAFKEQAPTLLFIS